MATRKPEKGTLSELLKEKPRRGRPPHAVSRQNVYVSLTSRQKALMGELGKRLPAGLSRADVPDLAVTVFAARFEALRRATAGRTREIPEGVTDLHSFYLLWDVQPPGHEEGEAHWTSLRLSPQQAIELGRLQGALNMRFGSNRSEVFALSLTLLEKYLNSDLPAGARGSLSELRDQITDFYL